MRLGELARRLLGKKSLDCDGKSAKLQDKHVSCSVFQACKVSNSQKLLFFENLEPFG